MLHINKEQFNTECVEETCSITNCAQCLNSQQCAICESNYDLGFDGECYYTGSHLSRNEEEGCA